MTTIERYRLRRLSLTPGRELPSRLADIKELPVILIEAKTADGTTGFADTMLIEGITPETHPDRVVPRQDDDAGAERDPLCLAGIIAQELQRVG